MMYNRTSSELDPVTERDQLRSEVAALRAQLDLYRQRLAEQEDLRVQVAALRRELGERSDPISAPIPTIAPQVSAPIPTIAPQTAPAAPGSPAPFIPPRHAPVQASSQGIDFGAVSTLSPAELDNLPYGLITLDAAGRVLHYNDTESRMVGLPKERVLGRNFFQDIAPCTRVREFEGRFRELVLDPVRVRIKTFDFVFRFARGAQHVTVVITPARVRGRFHVALVRRAVED